MKKYIKFILVFAACFLLVSCGRTSEQKQSENGTNSVEPTQQIDPNQSESEKNIAKSTQQIEDRVIIEVNSTGNYGIYDLSGEIINKLDNNPIDRDYETDFNMLNQSKNYSTMAQIELESKYIKIWDTELNAVYNKLLAKLDYNEKETLIESQKGWLQYHTKESEFVNQTFYLRDSGPLFGSQGKVQMQQAFKGRLRERTLELMEYSSKLGNEIEFVYKGK